MRGLCDAFSSVSSTITAGSNKWVLADGADGDDGTEAWLCIEFLSISDDSWIWEL